MQTAGGSLKNPWTNLRQFVRTRQQPAGQHCELCGLALAEEHSHLLEPATGQLLCSCEPCGILFSGQESSRYRRVPRDIEWLLDFRLSDAQWDDLHLPINLSFFVRSTPESLRAFYPSPAGATESLLALEAWQVLEAENPVLQELKPDVEALLVNRVNEAREYFRVPIDECFKLVGLIRANWRGLSGGSEVWQEVGRFFSSLKQRSPRKEGDRCAGPELHG
jgi:hypothetical protein